MATVFTSNLRLALPTTGAESGAWGTTVNDGITTLVDTAITGLASLSMTTADYTLSTANGATDEARCMFLTIGGSPGAARSIIVPALSKLYIVYNNSTGGYAQTVKTSAGTGISVPNGSRAVLYCDGTNVVTAATYASAMTLGTALPVASGGTGLSSAGTSGYVLASNGTAFVATDLAATTNVWTGSQTFTNSLLKLLGSSTGVTTFTSANAGASNYTITFPAATDTVVTLDATQTLTNKTIAFASNTLTGVGDVTLNGVQTLTNKTLTAPALGTPVSGILTNCTADGTNAVGFRTVPQNSQSTAYTAVLADSGKHLLHPSADTTARTFTIPANASVAYPIGTALTFVNQASAGVMTIAITSDTMRMAGLGTTGSRTLAANGIATALKITSTEWIISGTGLA